ncbi:MAG: phage tail protein [Pseudanabaena sp.]|jgi:phage tail-like protein|nr:phage tail protein [Pseudanabaena sp. M110S1SP2A07QC]MCA6531750.1 phage tail protein [Pseudanabaena sp. M125S2SP2A07QC]MCA6536710.1 phage tail protein [Pseudanabaena sp. M176S2SP2A07QC]MCA6539065.1 phage tail protein [Pseudanabaena sp. M037S2SP2A07QC]MCA6544407.1 phage tail protein [Pseudanabaena sp. M074S1SP2A07QC]MCA6545999.1 phage tail protein [Pseudanabaena sp. M152S2SP2A07QC]MCA6551038.1 phage tail protein [Pseudanabaena sp. M135S2SP2A07QC]MCA6557824.1 phage tail protein [Pseudanabae
MTPKSKLQALSIQLISMKSPDANEETLASADNLERSQSHLSQSNSLDNGRSPSKCNLLVNPSEPSEIVVKLRNSSNRTLLTNLRVEGNFPNHWLQIGMEGNELPPYAEMEAVLYFQVPADFFENQEAIVNGQALTINYQGQLQIYGGDASSASDSGFSPRLELFAIETFRLYIRPTSLYLDFLPDTYREVDFVGRMLKIFEETLEPDVQILDTLWAYLDPMLAPETMLPFLSHWVGWDTGTTLGVERQRYLIKQAMQIYRWRGTRRGLRFYIHLFTGLPLDEHKPEVEKHISIFEIIGRGFVIGEAILGSNASTGGGRPFHFVVRIRNDLQNSLDLPLIRRIIEREKPVFCTYDLEII